MVSFWTTQPARPSPRDLRVALASPLEHGHVATATALQHRTADPGAGQGFLHWTRRCWPMGVFINGGYPHMDGV